jgi:hypothetical protein
VTPGFANTMVESNSTMAGAVGTFEQVTISGPMVSKVRTLGTIVFDITFANVVNDGIDVQVTILNNGIDGVVDTGGS